MCCEDQRAQTTWQKQWKKVKACKGSYTKQNEIGPLGDLLNNMENAENEISII